MARIIIRLLAVPAFVIAFIAVPTLEADAADQDCTKGCTRVVKSGAIEKHFTYVKDKLHGVYKEVDEVTGNTLLHGYFRNGEKAGPWIQLDRAGRITQRTVYSGTRITSQIRYRYDRNGRLVETLQLR